MNSEKSPTLLDRYLKFFLTNKLIVFFVIVVIVMGGIYYMPFDLGIKGFPTKPIPVDAVPDIGDNQQIVFTEWPGRSPQDVEDQVTYPLTVALQGIPGVKNVRSYSMFGFSTVYVIFRDNVDFYWSRSRVLERLNIAQQRLPEGVIPALGPDATALGQVFWYTLEGKGFDLQELRSIQDWYVRYALQSVEGVSEVVAIGGYVKEYQIDVDPAAMRAHGVMLNDLFEAVKKGNIDVGAETIEHNGVEYVIRGKGFIKSVSDIEDILIKTTDHVPIYVRNVAKVRMGPALRRGFLEKEGGETVGGVVVVRYGENPMLVIKRIKEKLKEIQAGLPEKILPGGEVSQVRIVPFYDRTGLIQETLNTLKDSLVEEILITCFVIFILLSHFRSNLMICVTVPLAVLVTFMLMALFKIDSNLMSLGGIAIAIGAMDDMGVILSENIVRHFKTANPSEKSADVIYRASTEVGGAVLTAVATTIVSFLPVFALTGAEGKLFRPLAYTKTFALFAAIFVALTILPAFAHILFKEWNIARKVKIASYLLLIAGGVSVMFIWHFLPGFLLVLSGAVMLLSFVFTHTNKQWFSDIICWIAGLFVLALLTMHWMPLGLGTSLTKNLIFVYGVCVTWTLIRMFFIRWYPGLLHCFLKYKFRFLTVPLLMSLLGATIWLGFDTCFAWIPASFSRIGIPEASLRQTAVWSALRHTFPGMGREFMPPLDEGSFLFMPTTMPHAGISETLDIVRKQNEAIRAIPEIESVIGKVGRAETALDPAPTSMIETFIVYKPEYDVPDPKDGKRKRLWRDHIKTTDDIWNEIIRAASVPGSTSAPKLQPIAARIVMLQSGMRAPMGVKIYGKSLKEIESLGKKVAEALKEVPGVSSDTVQPDRVIGKPYLEITIDRKKTARYKLNIADVQNTIEIALGGIRATTTVEGRERYPVRIRYARELRDSPDELMKILIPTPDGVQIPLSQLADIEYVAGPQEIKSEDTFLVSYVLFDKLPEFAEVDVVEAAANHLEAKQKNGELRIPAGAHMKFSGTYENQVSFQERFVIILPLSLLLVFLVLYFQFRNTTVTLLVFIQIAVVWAGGFIGMWLAAQGWFLDFSVFGHNLREIFHFREYNLSVAVWVGFLALFGLATDDAVIIITYLEQIFEEKKAESIREIREMVVEGGLKRIRPCLMTTATTVLALLPVLTSSGKGADIMIPMALPIFSGVTFELVTLFITPVLYCLYKESQFKKEQKGKSSQAPLVAENSSVSEISPVPVKN